MKRENKLHNRTKPAYFILYVVRSALIIKIMTAEKKTKELINDFTYNCRECDYIENSKESALNCATKIWKELWTLYDNPNISDSAKIIIKERINFWADVKAELS